MNNEHVQFTSEELQHLSAIAKGVTGYWTYEQLERLADSNLVNLSFVDDMNKGTTEMTAYITDEGKIFVANEEWWDEAERSGKVYDDYIEPLNRIPVCTSTSKSE